jgi:REP element-mobilizing transposase RayT
MPRSLRLEFPGAFYHVMARGNQRESIFHDDDDRRFFLSTLSEACAMTGWRVHTWVLMDNHYHLFIETPEPNLVAGMRWLQNTVTRRYNVRHVAGGRLFGDRYKAVLVEGADSYHYRTLADYIHLNPVRARLVRPKMGQSVLDYPWSSLAGGWALPPGKRPKWLAAEEGLRRFDLPDTVAGRRRMAERLDRRAVEEEGQTCGMPVVAEDVDARCSHLRRGWYWGSQKFAGKLRELSEKRTNAKKRSSRASQRTPQATAHGEEQAKQWLKDGLAAAALGAKDLPHMKGSAPQKLALAELLWKRTTVSQEWIAQKLAMRSAANVSQQLLGKRKAEGSFCLDLHTDPSFYQDVRSCEISSMKNSEPQRVSSRGSLRKGAISSFA